MTYHTGPYRNSIYQEKPVPLDNATAHELANLMRAELDEKHTKPTAADYTRALRNVESLIELARNESTTDKVLSAIGRLSTTAFFDTLQSLSTTGKIAGSHDAPIEPDQDLETLRQKTLRKLTDAALALRQLKEKAARYKDEKSETTR